MLAASSTGSDDVPQSHLARMARTLEAIRADIPAMQPAAQAAAQRLADGGKLWIHGIPCLIGEFSGRAGGLMGLNRIKDEDAPCPGDVVLGFPREGQPLDVPSAPEDVLVITISDESCPTGAYCLPSHASDCSVSTNLAAAAAGWVFTGELIAALTTLGRMPVIYESIGAYGGYPRMRQYNDGSEQWHDEHTVGPTPPGVLGSCYVDSITGMLTRVELEQRANIDRARSWVSDARESGKRLLMYSMGHIFPDEIAETAIGEVFESCVWNAGFRRARPDHEYSEGDFIAHIGYQHPPDDLLRRARAVGAKVVYVCLRQDRDFTRDPEVIWIDPMWDWPDACVSLEGYDVPILAASGVIDGAIAWELAR